MSKPRTALTVACPICLAIKGSPCRTADHQTVKFHRARTQRLDAQIAARKHRRQRAKQAKRRNARALNASVARDQANARAKPNLRTEQQRLKDEAATRRAVRASAATTADAAHAASSSPAGAPGNRPRSTSP